jgi:hypothetical protein
MNIVSGVYDNMVLYYIVSKKNVMTYYNKIVAKLIGFQELKILRSNGISHINVFFYYILYCWLTKFINLIKFFRSYVDINTTHLHVVKLFPDNKNTIILNQPVICFKDLNKVLDNAENNDKMLDVVLLKFELVNGETTICLKNLVVKYKDVDTKYENTIGNILLFNDVLHSNDSILNIKLIRNKKMVNISTTVNDVYNKHINDILYFM